MTYKIDYAKLLANEGLLNRAEIWLQDNPPPNDWNDSPHAWAWVEMPMDDWGVLLNKLIKPITLGALAGAAFGYFQLSYKRNKQRQALMHSPGFSSSDTINHWQRKPQEQTSQL